MKTCQSFNPIKKVYYYKKANGLFVFSTGAVKDDEHAGQYLRMLRYSKKPYDRLFPDIPEDFRMIKRIFGVPDGKTWQELVNE